MISSEADAMPVTNYHTAEKEITSLAHSRKYGLWTHARWSCMFLSTLVFFTTAMAATAGQFWPKTKIPATKYLSQTFSHKIPCDDTRWIDLLVGKVQHVNTEEHMVSIEEAQTAKQFLQIIDIPEAIQRNFTQTRSDTLLTNASKSLCCALLLLDKSDHERESLNGPNQTKAKDLLKQMIAKYSTSKSAQDCLAASYADLLLALISGEGKLPYSESDLLRITRQYKKRYPERAMMAQYHLAEWYESQGKKKKAKAAYERLIKEYPANQGVSLYLEALVASERK